MVLLECCVGFIIAVNAFKLYVDSRQWLRYKNHSLPDTLKGLVSEEDYLKAQKYGFDKISFKMLQSYMSALEEIAVLYFGVLNWLWDKAEQQLFGVGIYSETLHALWFSLLLMIVNKVESISSEAYSTFVIEEKHGFNKTTWTEFFKDQVKHLLLGVTLQGFVLWVLLWLMKWGGEYFYIYIWGFLTVFIFVLSHLYHDFIAPLFNEFKELEQNKLRSSIEALAQKLKFPLKQIYVIDGSRRSEHSNAYFFGFWKNKRIVIFDTLLDPKKEMAEEEILAVVGHELGHWQESHFFKRLCVLEVYIFVLFFLFGKVMYSPELYSAFGFRQNNFVGLLIFSYLFAPVSFLLGLATVYMSRSHEFQADDFAKKLDMGGALKEALVKLHTKNSGNMNPDPLYAAVNFSHPALLERVKPLT